MQLGGFVVVVVVVQLLTHDVSQLASHSVEAVVVHDVSQEL